MQLVCPAGSLPPEVGPATGRRCLYPRFPRRTNARHFAGLNLDGTQLQEGLRVHEGGRLLCVAVNTYSAHLGLGALAARAVYHACRP